MTMAESSKNTGEGFLVDPDNLDLSLNSHDIQMSDAETQLEEEAIEDGIQVFPGELPEEEKPSDEQLANESVLQSMRKQGLI